MLQVPPSPSPLNASHAGHYQRGSINCSVCLYLDQILFTSVVDIICEEEEGNGDDELTTELVTEEDEILTVCQTLRILWKICSKLCEAEGNLGF